jgi:REP element-mobilizing transposase RayT
MAGGRQGELPFRTWGGRREGAGRKPVGARAGEPHRRRSALAARHPVHVTMRVAREVGRLRRPAAYRAVRAALLATLHRHDFRVVHVSIQATHLHLLVEADDERALACGVRGFAISAARWLNRARTALARRPRRGRVFPDRYHATAITTPRQARHALAYVLNNWRRHREDHRLAARLDPYSSAVAFPGWREHQGRAGLPWTPAHAPLPVAYPTTWLLTIGWRRHALVSTREVPGPAG